MHAYQSHVSLGCKGSIGHLGARWQSLLKINAQFRSELVFEGIRVAAARRMIAF